MTELTTIIRNLKAAVASGELTQEQAADLLNDMQDHEFEEKVDRMANRTRVHRRPTLIELFARFFGRLNYRSYIRSEEWRAKASAAKKRAGYRCQVCNKGPADGVRLEAHHRTYKNFAHEKPGDITVLCDECHGLFSTRQK